MTDRPPVPDLLDRAVLAVQSLMYASPPIRGDGTCALCVVDVTEEGWEHDPDCGWTISRRFAASDLLALQRLARALRYGPAERT